MKIGFGILKCPFFCILLPTFTATIWRLKALGLRVLEVLESPFTRSVVFFFPCRIDPSSSYICSFNCCGTVRQSVVLSIGAANIRFGPSLVSLGRQ